jgi:hypothetical protein
MSLYLNNGVKQFRRIITSAKYGIMQAISSYKAENFVPEIEYEWETQPARMARYYHNRNYVYNTVYNDVTRYANTFKFQEKLYKHIRGLYNPAYRLVNIETAKVIGGTIDYENFEDGALQIKEADENLKEAIRTICQWSNMDLVKNLYVRQGASMGDSALKVVDDTEKGKVRIEVLDPRKVTDIAFDSIGNVKYIDIRYEKQDPVSGEWYEYRECIDSESFQTFRNGSPFDYLDMSYAGTTQWDNPYGFVPVRWVQHQNVGLNFGVTSYHASRHKIDMVNDALSLLLNNVRMQVDTKFAVSKVNVPRVGGVPTTMSITSDRQDQAPFIEVGDGEIKPIVFPVNVEGALALAGVQMKEIESDLPQLALQQMRNSTGDSSGIAIENLYSDATDIIGEEQGNYLFGLQRALQMAISMASYRGYEGFASYNLDSYENGSLDFDFRPKALFQDKLSLKERVELALQAVKSEGARLILPLLDFEEKQILELELKKDERARKDVKAAFSDLMGLDEREAEAEQRLSDEKPAREYENS